MQTLKQTMYQTLTMYLTIILIGFPHSTVAGNIDLAIHMDIAPVTEVDFADNNKFSITITNNGPDTAGVESTSLYPIRSNSSEIIQHPNGDQDLRIMQDTSIPQSCFFISIFGSPLPGGDATEVFAIAFPQIPANSSITCYGIYQVGFREGSRDFNFGVRSFSDTEDNLSDNIYNFTLSIKPQVIPSLNTSMLILLGLLLLIIATIQHKKFNFE
ncbi:MAG: hypothetical protein L3J53_01395 [Proteobacteria bacterium]|nr:hypothetical protein [Pseudomonadota bacterium]